MAGSDSERQPTTSPSPPPLAESIALPTEATNTEATVVPPVVAPIAPAAPRVAADEADSTLGSEDEDSTASLRSSIFEYRTIRGRTFHKETGNASYWGSNDEGHNESLDVLHHLFTLLLDGKLYIAPITENPKHVLDIGTGTGIWAIEFADEHPECEIIGTDISPIQPPWVPPNLRFEIEDCTQEWTYEENKFDFVHIRYLSGCIVDWTEFFKQAYRCLRPGGYLESYEGSPVVYSQDGPLPEAAATAQWGPLFVEGGKKIGRSFEIVDDGTQRKAMQEAGFVGIQEKWIKVPAGAWPADPKLKEIGQFAEFAVMSDVEGFIIFFTNVLGWTIEEVRVFIALLRRELKSMKHHVYYWQKIVYGKKP